jgi:hypothetical protein
MSSVNVALRSDLSQVTVCLYCALELPRLDHYAFWAIDLSQMLVKSDLVQSLCLIVFVQIEGLPQ